MINNLVVLYSALGLACIALMFLVDWLFIIPAVVFMLLNQRQLGLKK